jgi:hypothetical protein
MITFLLVLILLAVMAAVPRENLGGLGNMFAIAVVVAFVGHLLGLF